MIVLNCLNGVRVRKHDNHYHLITILFLLVKVKRLNQHLETVTMGNSQKKMKKSKIKSKDDDTINIDDEDYGDPIDNSDIIDKTNQNDTYTASNQKANDQISSINDVNTNESVDDANNDKTTNNNTKSNDNENADDYTFDDDNDGFEDEDVNENENDGFDDEEKKTEEDNYEFDDDDDGFGDGDNGNDDGWGDVELLEDGQQKIIHMEDEDAETMLKRALEKRRIEAADVSKFWKCGKCTFLNHPSRAVCMSCRMPQIDIVYHILQSDMKDDVKTCHKCQGTILAEEYEDHVLDCQPLAIDVGSKLQSWFCELTVAEKRAITHVQGIFHRFDVDSNSF